MMPEQFISEPIQPIANSFDTRFMSSGTPGLPREFLWRGTKFRVTDIRRVWRTTGPCRHGSGEQYVRRYWFEVETSGDQVMKIYFDKGTPGRRKEMGWHLFAVGEKKLSGPS